MEVMQFILGLSLGLVAGYLLRDYVHRIDYFFIGHGRYGSKTKHKER